MPTYCLSTTLTASDKDLILGAWAECEMLGMEEDDVEGALVAIKAFFPDEQSLGVAEYVLMSYPLFSPLTVTTVEDKNWNEKWRETIEPVMVAQGLWVSPSWREPPLKEIDIWIKIEPKMTFGTGHHETTRLAAQSLFARREALENGLVLDVGCGTGLLAFIAAHFGARGVIGVEIDELTWDNMGENLRDNAALGPVALIVGDIQAVVERSIFDVTVMNMLLRESVPVLPAISKRVKNGGGLIWSGLLATERDEAVAAARKHHFSLMSELTEGEWWAGSFCHSTKDI